MKAKSIKGRSPDAIQTALQQSMDDGFKPTLGFVFISIKQDREAICKILHRAGIDIVGATSSGEFINGYQDAGSAVVLLLDLDRAAYTILFEDIGDRSVSDVAAQIARVALQKFKRPAFILCSTGVSAKGEYLDGEMLVRSMENVVGPQVTIYGGMAGDDLTITGTYVFTYEKASDTGIAALVLDEDKVSLCGMAISGWKPIGTFKTVTKSEGAWVYAIDDQPALEMYLRYLGKEPIEGEDKYKLFDETGLFYPFQVERERGEPVMRTPMTFNREKNALMCDFDVPQGSKIRFSMPPDFDIVEKVLGKANELKNTTQGDAEALLIFSCAGRLSALGPMISEENEGLSEIWKAPMAGFFTYGEYGRAINGGQEFHSTTCCWVALKEK
jgi:hypothetical protein